MPGKKYFSDWIKVPDRENLLEVSIFFDFRHCYGEEELTTLLRDYVLHNLIANDIYFHHMTNAWLDFQPPAFKEVSGTADIKKLIMPLTGIVRLYTLKNGKAEHSTISRLLTLYEAGQFNNELFRDSLKVFKELTSVRFRHQAGCIKNGCEPDNLIDLAKASENTLFSIRDAVRVINELLLKASADFHATEI